MTMRTVVAERLAGGPAPAPPRRMPPRRMPTVPGALRLEANLDAALAAASSKAATSPESDWLDRHGPRLGAVVMLATATGTVAFIRTVILALMGDS